MYNQLIEHAEYLPNKLSALYQISFLPLIDIPDYIDSKKLHPRTTINDVMKLLGKKVYNKVKNEFITLAHLSFQEQNRIYIGSNDGLYKLIKQFNSIAPEKIVIERTIELLDKETCLAIGYGFHRSYDFLHWTHDCDCELLMSTINAHASYIEENEK